MTRILICTPQVPFVHGGAELLVDHLAAQLSQNQFEIDKVSIPFQDWPHEALIRSAAAWRLLDIDHLTPFAADIVITTKFPSYFVSHPNKIVWLFHNYRPVYDLHGTPYSGYSAERADDLQLIQWIAQNDRAFLGESRKILAISKNVRNRLHRFLGLEAEVLYPPPPLEGRFYCESYEPFIFVAQRLDAYKRTDLLLQSLPHVRGDYQVLIAGTGPDEKRLRKIAAEQNVEDKVQFLGRISDDELLKYYSRCRFVFNAPYDEDYGFTTAEALLSRKPVLTANDSGGSLEFVEHQATGLVAEPKPEGIAEAIQKLLDDPELARAMGEEGFTRTAHLKWENTIARFLQIFRELSE